MFSLNYLLIIVSERRIINCVNILYQHTSQVLRQAALSSSESSQSDGLGLTNFLHFFFLLLYLNFNELSLHFLSHELHVAGQVWDTPFSSQRSKGLSLTHSQVNHCLL